VKTRANANPYYDHSEEAAVVRAIGELGMYDDGYEYSQNGYGKDTRPRATTIGALDNPHRRATPQGYLASIPQSPVMGNMMPSMSSVYGYPPRSRSDRDLNRSRESSVSRGPRMSMSSHTSRAGTPDVNGTSTPQMPTRSLWIGNLDVNATSDALLQVFSPYGAIESVRMLPEKVGSKCKLS
jgi:protein JSN1